MRKNSYLQLVVIILISALVGYYLGLNKVSVEWKNYLPSAQIVNKEPPASIANEADFSNFWNVWQKLESGYYDKSKLDPQKMVNGAIEGMVGSLNDPFTLYLPPTQNTDFKQGLAGQFQGIGAELGLRDKRIIVVAPLNGSPAQKSGIKPGDYILKVDNQATDNWSLSEAVDKIRGPKGSTVTLTIAHSNETKTENVKIVRDTITIKSVDGYVKAVKDIGSIKVSKDLGNEKIAYIALSQFGDNTNHEWLSLVNNLNLEIQKGGVRGMILDLRNNPGGYLTDATFIASEFLEQGQPVVIEDSGTDKTTLSTTRKGLLGKIPLIVLLNKGSASASEIVAGSLRDNGRAKLAGEVSFGKGTIQQAEDLGNGAGLHVTIAKWLTPNGTWVNGVGLTPDIQISVDQKDPSHDNQLEKSVLELLK